MPVVMLSGAHWLDWPPKRATPSTANMSQMTAVATMETPMLGMDTMIEWVTCLSSVIRESSMKTRRLEKASSTRRQP